MTTELLPYLTTDDMAAMTGKSRDYWARVCQGKKIPAIKLGNDWRVARDEFEKFMRGGGKATARNRYSSRGRKSA